MFKKIVLIIIACFAVVLLVTGTILFIAYPHTSVISSIEYLIQRLKSPHKKMKKEVIGFLTYWRMADDDMKSIRQELLTEIIYFSLTIGENGHLKHVENGQTDPGYLKWTDKKTKDYIAYSKIRGTKFSLNITLLDNETIESFLSDRKNWNNLIHDVAEEIKNNKLDGINLDIEYAGDAPSNLRNDFSLFAKEFTTFLHKSYPHLTLSVDTYAMSLRKNGLINIAEVAPYFDKVIIMAYDFYASGSKNSGPIGPLFGYAQNKFYFDIQTSLADYEKHIPLSNIILGIPYYGYDWPVKYETNFMSETLPGNEEYDVEILSYSRARKESKYNQKDTCLLDEFAQEPWCWYQDEETGVSRQAWFQNNKSIEQKFTLADKKNMKGIAIWALGYDKGYVDLWDKIKKLFTD